MKNNYKNQNSLTKNYNKKLIIYKGNFQTSILLNQIYQNKKLNQKVN